MYGQRGRIRAGKYCGSVEDNGFLSGTAHSGHTEPVSTGLWKGVGEEPVGGPDPVKGSPLPPLLDPEPWLSGPA